jgi:hypothetical protein
MSAIEAAASHVDTSWMNNEPIGRAVEGMRRYGNRIQRDKDTKAVLLKDGEPYFRALYFWPDPWNRSDQAYLVCDGVSVRFNPEKPWQSFVTIQLADGSTKTLDNNELANYMRRDHWGFVTEKRSERDAAAKAVGFSISTQGYQPARVTEG